MSSRSLCLGIRDNLWLRISSCRGEIHKPEVVAFYQWPCFLVVLSHCVLYKMYAAVHLKNMLEE